MSQANENAGWKLGDGALSPAARHVPCESYAALVSCPLLAHLAARLSLRLRDPGSDRTAVEVPAVTTQSGRTSWTDLLSVAARIVAGYNTGVTLRQLFYRLVAAELLPNTRVAYQTLSRITAEARRRGAFPALVDRTRSIHRHVSFDGVADARQWLGEIYRRDRTAGQAWSIYLGVEKAGIVEQLRAWFGEFGLPVLALGGYSSQTYVDEIVCDVEVQDRPAVLIYAGDFDPSGEDIDRDFCARTGCFTEVVRVALTSTQVVGHHLPEQMGKSSDSRSAAFVARHGRLVQVELDALPPDVLHDLYAAAIERFWDESAFDTAVEREQRDREDLLGAERG